VLFIRKCYRGKITHSERMGPVGSVYGQGAKVSAELLEVTRCNHQNLPTAAGRGKEGGVMCVEGDIYRHATVTVARL
jgi:hypothetical protein